MSKKHIPATITVHGRATSFASPDEARCTLVLAAVHPAAPAAMDDVAARSQTLAGVLDALGIDPADRFTSSVTVGDHTEYPEGIAVYMGKRAVVQVEVRVRDLTQMAALLKDAADRAGATVEAPRYSVAAENPAQLEAYRLAATDAARRASAYAEGLGVEVGAVLAVAEQGAEVLPRFAAKVMSADAGLRVEAGEMEVSAAVSVTFAIA